MYLRRRFNFDGGIQIWSTANRGVGSHARAGSGGAVAGRGGEAHGRRRGASAGPPRADQAPPVEHLYKDKHSGDLLQVVNAPGGSVKTLALATLLAEQEEIRSRSATWQLVEGLGSCAPRSCTVCLL